MSRRNKDDKELATRRTLDPAKKTGYLSVGISRPEIPERAKRTLRTKAKPSDGKDRSERFRMNVESRSGRRKASRNSTKGSGKVETVPESLGARNGAFFVTSRK